MLYQAYHDLFLIVSFELKACKIVRLQHQKQTALWPNSHPTTFRWKLKQTLLRREGSRNESFDTDAAMRARKRAGWHKHTLGDGPTLIITRNYSKGPK